MGGGDRTIETVGGSTILLKSSELHELGEIVPVQHHDRIRVPLIVIRRMDLGKSIYSVGGERVEEFTIMKILRITNDDYTQLYRHREPLYLYHPQVTELLNRFHSLVVIGFGIPRELTDYAPNRL